MTRKIIGRTESPVRVDKVKDLHPKHHAENGFTLIELMLVVAIVAVMSALAAPRYTSSLNRYRADAAALRIATDLTLAQSRARSTSSSRSVAFNIAGNSYQLPGEAGINISTSTYTLNLSHAPYYVSLQTVSFGGNPTITFNGYGIPDNAGSVSITSGGIVRTIVIDGVSGVPNVQ